MDIIYLHQYFLTPDEGGANRSYYMAKALVDAGHKVTMLTGHNESYFLEKKVDGINVVYLPVSYANHYGFARRIYSFFRYIKLAKSYLKQHHSFDKCIATSTPLTIGLIAIWLKKKFQIPYVFEVRDLWPEAPIQMRVIKTRFMKWVLEKMEHNIYKHAEKIIALSPGMRNAIEKRQKSVPVEMIPNMSDCHFFEPVRQKDSDLEIQYGVKNKFVVSYIGAAGMVNNLEGLLMSAKACMDLPIRFLIMAKGAKLATLKKLCKTQNINNVSFISYGTKQEVKDLLNITDASYISFANVPILQTNSPNKFFDSIAAGKLIISNTEGWLREIIEKYHFGFYTDAQFPSDFREKILPFLNNASLLHKYQDKARTTAEQFFSRKQLSQQFVNIIEGKDRLDSANSQSAYNLTA